MLTKFIYTSKIHSNQSINYLLTEEKKVRIKKLRNPNSFNDYSQTINDVYENLENSNSTQKKKVLVAFDDMIADMKANTKLNLIVTELFLRGRKPNISLVFRSQFYFKVPQSD